jgi:circadian clock protein KaiB
LVGLDLRLYVADRNSQSIRAFNNPKKACEEHISGRYHMEVIDLFTYPEKARADQSSPYPLLSAGTPSRLGQESAA